ncbi:MAG: hypothetical protein AXW15_07875 [Neptuniibacter sp. Phe_28]|nr:MAG: hypothetical protein AXW15_07875 [Neptuniibacter sp. Phe_28]
MHQTRIESLLESIVNIVIGYVVALISQIVVFPMVGIEVSITTNLVIGFWFTLISLVRSYVIRRWFNAGLHRAIASAARKLAS